MTARPIRRNAQTPDRNGKIFYTSTTSLSHISKMLREKTVHEISFMDHTPGQGQYRNIETYRKTITAYHGETVTTLGFEGVLEGAGRCYQ